MKIKLHLVLNQQLDMVDLGQARSKHKSRFSVDVPGINFNLVLDAMKLNKNGEGRISPFSLRNINGNTPLSKDQR